MLTRFRGAFWGVENVESSDEEASGLSESSDISYEICAFLRELRFSSMAIGKF